MLHGASGVLTEREMTYGRQFAAMGVAALVVDVFGARRDRGTGFTARLLNITEAMVLADAYAGLRYLDGLPEVDGERVVLIGFSYGGMATTYAAYAQVAETFAPGGERFAGHVAYYAPCIAEFEDGRATGAPLLMLYGGKDAIIDPDRCATVAETLEAGGAEVETIVYPEAVHQWDGRFGSPRMIGRNLKGCGFHVARDGTVSDSFLPITMSDPFTRKLILAFCVAKDGYMIGRDDAVRDRSNADLARFLEKVFGETAQ
jgi:dienelactone hydrolase